MRSGHNKKAVILVKRRIELHVILCLRLELRVIVEIRLHLIAMPAQIVAFQFWSPKNLKPPRARLIQQLPHNRVDPRQRQDVDQLGLEELAPSHFIDPPRRKTALLPRQRVNPPPSHPEAGPARQLAPCPLLDRPRELAEPLDLSL